MYKMAAIKGTTQTWSEYHENTTNNLLYGPVRVQKAPLNKSNRVKKLSMGFTATELPQLGGSLNIH